MNAQFSIIGCEHGHIAMFIEDMLRLGYTCAGLYEPRNLELARAVSEKFGIPLAASPEHCLGPSVAFVGSSAINRDKIGIIEQCEERGKHIMLDKPAVTDASGLERLENVLSRGNIQVGMLLTSRFNASLQRLKELIQRGELGDIVHIGIQKPHRLNPHTRPPWHFSKADNGGIVIDLMIHDFDLLRWLTGKEPQAFQGFAANRSQPAHPGFRDTASVHVLMEGGATAHLYADWLTPDASWAWGDYRVFVTGTRGKAEARLSGDPLVSQEELLLLVTNDRPLERCALEPVRGNPTEDFVGRALGKAGIPMIGHRDILLASAASIEADRVTRFLE